MASLDRSWVLNRLPKYRDLLCLEQAPYAPGVRRSYDKPAYATVHGEGIKITSVAYEHVE